MKKGLIISLVFSMCIFSTSVLAETFNVSTTQEFRQALLDAAQNGQEDTIILADGTYRTTDDGLGTFTFLDNENYTLTIQGSSPENVILSGDQTHDVLNFNVVESTATMYLDSLSVVDGTLGIYSNIGIDIQDCIISQNTNIGGLKLFGDASIRNSTIIGNSTYAYGGGIYVATGTLLIQDSYIIGNTADIDGGGIYAGGLASITNSTISNNTVINGDGAGIFSYLQNLKVTDCIISNNSIPDEQYGTGGGIYASRNLELTSSTVTGNTIFGAGGAGVHVGGDAIVNESIIISNNSRLEATNGFVGGRGMSVGGTTIIRNSILSNNYNGGLKSSKTATILNSLFSNNGTQDALHLYATTNKVLNSIFINNEGNDIGGSSNSTVTAYNNFLDESKVAMPAFFMNNISSGYLDFADPANCDFHIGPNSILLDAGTTTIGDVVFPPTDFDGNPRVVGTSIDIGPYEYTDDPNKKEPRPTECGYPESYIFPGTNKEASPLEGINITFDLVLSGGVCSAETISDSSPPTDFRFIEQTFDIDFTGTFTGSVETCFDYDESGVNGDEANISLMHRQNSSSPWEDITTFVDTETNTVCGNLTSFSEFAIAEPQAASDSGGGGGGGGGCFINTLLN